MKRIIALILATILLMSASFALTSCGGGKTPAPDFVMPEGGLDENTEITITFYHEFGQEREKILTSTI